MDVKVRYFTRNGDSQMLITRRDGSQIRLYSGTIEDELRRSHLSMLEMEVIPIIAADKAMIFADREADETVSASQHKLAASDLSTVQNLLYEFQTAIEKLKTKKFK